MSEVFPVGKYGKGNPDSTFPIKVRWSFSISQLRQYFDTIWSWSYSQKQLYSRVVVQLFFVFFINCTLDVVMSLLDINCLRDDTGIKLVFEMEELFVDL